MNEIPLTRDGLRRQLTTAVTASGIAVTAPDTWRYTHKRCTDDLCVEQGDLWLYSNYDAVKPLLVIVKEALSYIDFRPAVTVAGAIEAQQHIADAYDRDEASIRTFLTQPPLYLNELIQGLIRADVGDWNMQPPMIPSAAKQPLLTPPLMHDALKSLWLLSKQPTMHVALV